MKKLAVALALTLAAPAFAEPTMYPSHVVQDMVLGLNPGIQIELLAVAITTQTAANNNRTVILTSDNAGTQAAPTTSSQGLDLTNLGGVSVILKTASAATAGGTLQAYLYNPDADVWARAPDLDLTAIATTAQTWPALYVPVARGRLYYNPVGIGSVVTTVYLVGQTKPAL
jgi:hypothetical protein